jgi:hypothetical protein
MKEFSRLSQVLILLIERLLYDALTSPVNEAEKTFTITPECLFPAFVKFKTFIKPCQMKITYGTIFTGELRQLGIGFCKVMRTTMDLTHIQRSKNFIRPHFGGALGEKGVY